MTYSIVMTACKSRKEAKKISDALLKKKLAACVKTSSVRSSYWWKGRIENSNEVLVSITTAKKNVARIMSAVKKMHSYEVPEIVEVPIRKGDEKYLRWVRDVTG